MRSVRRASPAVAGAPLAAEAPQALESRLTGRIAHDYFVRFHMSVILAAVVSSGVLTSKGLMVLGVSFGYRYPFAVLTSYAVFLGLVRLWIWYVTVRIAGVTAAANLATTQQRSIDSGSSVDLSGAGDFLDIGGGGSGSGGGFSGFGGGTSGGGGASSSWEGNEIAAVVSGPSPGAPSGGGSGPGSGLLPDLDIGGLDDDGMIIVVILGALVVFILGGGFYLIYAAPHILPEAAAQVALAGGLSRISKEEHHDWMRGVLRATWIPFVVVLVVAGVLGWQAHRYCPSAHRLMDVFHCPVQ